jgi:hypothetical protein
MKILLSAALMTMFYSVALAGTPTIQPKGPMDIQDNSQAWSMGTWTHSKSVSGYYGVDYEEADKQLVKASDLTWSYVFQKDGLYGFFEHHVADKKNTKRADYILRTDGHSYRVSVDQTKNGGTFNRALVVLGKKGHTITINLSNAAKSALPDENTGKVIADAIGFQEVNDIYLVTETGDEYNPLTISCDKGDTFLLLRGIYGDGNFQNSCFFDETDALIHKSGDQMTIGNYLCGDPNWGARKTVQVEVFCAKANQTIWD